MKLEFFTCSPEDFEEYLRELGGYWNASILCSTAKAKTEYGGHTSFYEYAHFLGYEVELLAEKFSLDSKKALGFFYYLISAFPQYGEEGMRAIKEYLEAKGKKYDRVSLLSQAALVDLDDTGGLLFDPIEKVFLDLFDVYKESKSKEIEFAKMFCFIVNLLKKADLIGKEDEMKEYAIDLINESYKTRGPRACIRLLKEKASSIHVDGPQFDEKMKRTYFEAIESYEEGGVSDYPIASFILHATL